MFASVTDACREYARNVGGDRPDLAWICTDYDTWEPNPFYRGPAVRHPEADQDYDDTQEVVASRTSADLVFGTDEDMPF